MVEPLPTEEAKANTTDPDSRIMKTRQGYVQGYNAQAVVSEEQIIVAVGVTQEANDVQQLEPMLQNHGAYPGSSRHRGPAKSGLGRCRVLE